MKALLVSHSNGGGGAGRATQRLFTALHSEGIDVRMYADFKHGDDAQIETIHGSTASLRRRIRIAVEEVPGFIASHPSKQLFSPGIASAVRASTINRSDANVVNLHWTGYGTLSVRQIGRIRKPVVWTLHDMWAFTGGLGYESDAPDAPWRLGYERTAPSTRVDIECWVARRKQRHWVDLNVHLVAPSRWLAECVRESALLGGQPVSVIPNTLDLQRFAPRDQGLSRISFGISPRVRLIVVALGGDLSDDRKGFDLLVEALQQLEPGSVELAIAGHAVPPPRWPSVMPKTHWLGRLDDDALVRAYTAADVVVVPSRQDNLPQTATEPQACGVPVVAFACGGLADAVEPDVTGLLAEPSNPVSLARQIERVLVDPALREELGLNARRRAERLWSPAVVGAAYADLFRQVTS